MWAGGFLFTYPVPDYMLFLKWKKGPDRVHLAPGREHSFGKVTLGFVLNLENCILTPDFMVICTIA